MKLTKDPKRIEEAHDILQRLEERSRWSNAGSSWFRELEFYL